MPVQPRNETSGGAFDRRQRPIARSDCPRASVSQPVITRPKAREIQVIDEDVNHPRRTILSA